MSVVGKFVHWLWTIKNRQHIPPVPRMYSSGYDNISREDGRLMARYGIRSPSGIRAAMKKHKVNTVDELVAILEHYRARRNIARRLLWGLRRVAGGTPYPPHRAAIRRHFAGQNATSDELRRRVKRVKQ